MPYVTVLYCYTLLHDKFDAKLAILFFPFLSKKHEMISINA